MSQDMGCGAGLLSGDGVSVNLKPPALSGVSCSYWQNEICRGPPGCVPTNLHPAASQPLDTWRGDVWINLC